MSISMYLNNVVLWSKEVEFLVREMTCSCASPVPNDINDNVLDECTYSFCFYLYSQTDKTLIIKNVILENITT